MHVLKAALIGFAALAVAVPATAQRVERGNLVTENIPEIPAEVAERLRQYENTRGAAFRGWTSDGGILISTRFGETSQVHRVDEPLGVRRQLTFYTEPVAGAAYRRGRGRAFAFGKDTGGDENFQYYLFDMEAGSASAFTEPGTRNGSAIWSRDGARVAWYRSTAGDADWDILIASPSDPSTLSVVMEGDGAMAPGDWSEDGSSLIISKYVSITESYLYTLNIARGMLKKINPSDQDIAYGGAEFVDRDTALITTYNEGSDFRRLVRINLVTGDEEVLTPDLNWDVTSFDVSPNGRWIAYAVNVGGLSELRLYDLNRGRDMAGPELPPGLVFGVRFDEAGRNVGFTFNSSSSPGDVWSYDIKDKDLTRWTASEVGGLDTDLFVAPELIAYPTFDEVDGAPRQIPAFVYRPKGDGPHPVIINIHGGPEGQYRPRFAALTQYMLNELGAAVVAPNVRGSSGYGKTYVALDNGFNREDSVKDIGALLDWIATQPDLDETQVVVYGRSYGGYMVLASLVHYSDRLAGGVQSVGISNFVTFLENTKGYRRDLRRVEYGDERDPEMRAFLESIAPANNVEKITKPLLISQGLNDPRVPASEAEQMLAAMKTGGVETWYLLAKDEGHSFRKKRNRDYRQQAEIVFMMRVLGL